MDYRSVHAALANPLFEHISFAVLINSSRVEGEVVVTNLELALEIRDAVIVVVRCLAQRSPERTYSNRPLQHHV